jgi:hypothetical protein
MGTAATATAEAAMGISPFSTSAMMIIEMLLFAFRF